MVWSWHHSHTWCIFSLQSYIHRSIRTTCMYRTVSLAATATKWRNGEPRSLGVWLTLALSAARRRLWLFIDVEHLYLHYAARECFLFWSEMSLSSSLTTETLAFMYVKDNDDQQLPELMVAQLIINSPSSMSTRVLRVLCTNQMVLLIAILWN